MARDERENPQRLHSGSSEPTMAGDEPSAMANTGTAFRTIPIETKHTEMKYRLTRTQWDTNL